MFIEGQKNVNISIECIEYLNIIGKAEKLNCLLCFTINWLLSQMHKSFKVFKGKFICFLSQTDNRIEL